MVLEKDPSFPIIWVFKQISLKETTGEVVSKQTE
jgi:hypothetical protein